MVHIHNRDELGYHKSTVELMKETVDMIVDKCPNIIIQPSSCEGYAEDSTQYEYKTVKPMVDTLHAISKKHMESTIFTPISYVLEHLEQIDPDMTLASCLPDTSQLYHKTILFFQVTDNGILISTIG